MDKFCGRCGSGLIVSNNSDYDYQCLQCDEDFYKDEIFVLDEKEYIEKQIKYYEDKMKVCAYSKEDLQVLAKLEYELNKLESGDNNYDI